ncbi:hypothetical protein [Moorena sp. SIO3B2]|nr:hypothetical protein [Moorena sp. SIO3B2]
MIERCKNLDEVEELPHLVRCVDELRAIAEKIEGETGYQRLI